LKKCFHGRLGYLLLDFLGRGELRLMLRFKLEVRIILILKTRVRFRFSKTRRQRLRISSNRAHGMVRDQRAITIGIQGEGLTHGDKARIRIVPLGRHHCQTGFDTNRQIQKRTALAAGS
jgi:hypothetical protein